MNKIILIGSGPILIGQGCEFDYSGVQASKLLIENKYKVIIINSNPATLMTDRYLGCKVYIEPINFISVCLIIKKEKPNFIVSNMGGQTSLNLILELYENKIIEKYNIKIIGTKINSIINSESRSRFNKIITGKFPIVLAFPSNNLFNALKIRRKFIKRNINQLNIRPSYTLGGLGGGTVSNIKDFINTVKLGLRLSKINEIIIEQSIYGYKEFEFEIIKNNKNKLLICIIENIDPVGIHTGDSICICPSISLTNNEYQKLRKVCFKIVDILEINNSAVNIQFAINQYNNNFYIIEINSRVSRSSALASKITGYPIARVSTQLSIGINILNIYNKINDSTAGYEPAVDYIVTKVPKFSNNKFFNNRFINLDIQMKSIGESMGIGGNFRESLLKSTGGLKTNSPGIKSNLFDKYNFLKRIKYGHSNRINNVYDTFRSGINVTYIVNKSNINFWFLNKINKLIEQGNELLKFRNKINNKNFIIIIKKQGFLDTFISDILKISIIELFKIRCFYNIYPSYFKIDGCSGEFNSNINYLYSNYYNFNESFRLRENNSIIIGSGPNRIGQGMEFDYCCTHATLFIKKHKGKSIIINCNPVTISTDYNISNKLYLVPINIEEIINIYRLEIPKNIIIQYSGQITLKLLNELNKIKNINILGSVLDIINISEDRKRFSQILEKLMIKTPVNVVVNNNNELFRLIKNISLPIIIRPSYVLGGGNMRIIRKYSEYKNIISSISNNSITYPILIDEFINKSIEFDLDVITNSNNVYITFISQHIEPAGIHSGDSSSFISTSFYFKKHYIKISKIIYKISKVFNIIGIFNLQLLIKNSSIYIIEMNLRASRTIPFLTKYFKISLVKLSLKVSYNKIKRYINKIIIKRKLFGFKESSFSFIKFNNCDTILGPEMKSTGEVMNISKKKYIAYIKTQLSLEYKFYYKNTIILISYKYNILMDNILYYLYNNLYIYLYNNLNNIFYKNILFVSIKDINRIIFYNKILYALIYPDSINNYILKKIRILLKDYNIPIYTTLSSIKSIILSIKNLYNLNIYNL